MSRAIKSALNKVILPERPAKERLEEAEAELATRKLKMDHARSELARKDVMGMNTFVQQMAHEANLRYLHQAEVVRQIKEEMRIDAERKNNVG